MSSVLIASKPLLRPSGLNSGLVLLIPALIRASSVCSLSASSCPSADLRATSTLMEFEPISMTATGLDGMLFEVGLKLESLRGNHNNKFTFEARFAQSVNDVLSTSG